LLPRKGPITFTPVYNRLEIEGLVGHEALARIRYGQLVHPVRLCRRASTSSATFYKWKATYGGMDLSQARKLKVLEAENGRLNRLLADAMLDNAVLKEVSEVAWQNWTLG
jgi:putative transposase